MCPPGRTVPGARHGVPTAPLLSAHSIFPFFRIRFRPSPFGRTTGKDSFVSNPNSPALLDGSGRKTQDLAWSPIPPKPVRRRFYGKARSVRRPAGTLALPAIATTSVLYFTEAIARGDSPMALGLTGLVVVYDAVIAVCRTWQKTHAATRQHAQPRGSLQRSA